MIIQQKQKIIQVYQQHRKGSAHMETKLITTLYFLWIPVFVRQQILTSTLA